jgi:D-alanyl-D-alanine dipeptidase
MSNRDLEIIERDFISYAEMANITSHNVYADNEKFVALSVDTEAPVFGRYQDDFCEMREFTPQPLVRAPVSEKLQNAGRLIGKINSNWQLVVTEGWRSLEIQTRKFNEKYQELEDIELAHRMIAAPDVAGHPSGGAVDVMIYDRTTGKPLDFGSKIYDFTDKICYVNHPKIKKDSAAWANRILLRGIMMSQGFSPYDGEWWHFSYGDREWAAFFGKKEFLFSQKTFDEIELHADSISKNQ